MKIIFNIKRALCTISITLLASPVFATTWQFNGQPCSNNSCNGWSMTSSLDQTWTENLMSHQNEAQSMWGFYTIAPGSYTLTISSSLGSQSIDNTFDTKQFVLVKQGNVDIIYKLSLNGKIYQGQSDTGFNWVEIDNNWRTTIIDAGMVAGVPSLFILHNNGQVWRYNGQPRSWSRIDNNYRTTDIVLGKDEVLYQLHNNGQIWRLFPNEGSPWQQIDKNGANRQIVWASNLSMQSVNSVGGALITKR